MKVKSLLFLSCWLISVGCATKVYQGPSSGRGAEPQLAIATSARKALEQFDAKPLEGRRVALEVHSLTPAAAGRSPEEAYFENQLTECLIRAGAKLSNDRREADVLLSARLESIGVDVIRRDLPPFYHHTTFRGLVAGHLVQYRLEDGDLKEVERTVDIQREASYTEIYVFYIIGPFKTISLDELEEDQSEEPSG